LAKSCQDGSSDHLASPSPFDLTTLSWPSQYHCPVNCSTNGAANGLQWLLRKLWDTAFQQVPYSALRESHLMGNAIFNTRLNLASQSHIASRIFLTLPISPNHLTIVAKVPRLALYPEPLESLADGVLRTTKAGYRCARHGLAEMERIIQAGPSPYLSPV